MTLVRIIKNWDQPDLLRQLPGGRNVWNNIEFTLEPVTECDYAIILNMPVDTVKVYCPPENIWAIMQEPPNEVFGKLHKGQRIYARVYTSDMRLKGKKYVQSQPALPWHVGRDYDFLKNFSVPEKKGLLSCIISNKTTFQGHRDRINFLSRLRNQIDLDLYGKGFSFIPDKWDGLVAYHYSLALENFRNQYYWSEKLADCFLAWTMPIYFGCTHITHYFPPESMIIIDIHDPDAYKKIEDSLQSNLWQKNLDAIAVARQKVLEEYQLFPFLAHEIELSQLEKSVRQTNIIHVPTLPQSWPKRIKMTLKGLRSSFLKRQR